MRSVATLLADPPSASSTEEPPASGSPEAAPPPAAPETLKRSCVNCGAPMEATQEWCLQCGAGAAGSLATPARNTRWTAMVLGVTALLVAGAATAAYAAWGKAGPPHRVIAIIEPSPAASPTTPLAPTAPGASTPTTPKAPGTPTTISPSAKAVTPPKIPLTATTPTSGGASNTSTPEASNKTTPTKTKTPAQQPTPITLDTNAAATYNPYAYPAARFGDPSLAIDGDPSTAWTAQVDPAVAPKMAEGLVIDLKTARKLSALDLVTATPGMTVQVYGANTKALPLSIIDPAWVHLSLTQVEKNKHVRIKLRDSTRAFRFVTLWIAKAPAASIGTAQAPGHVSVNELELFPA
jgi:hypothetical protein